MTAWLDGRGDTRRVAVLIWLLTVLLGLIAARASISALVFHDPDDAMRLVQVRDWLAGQSWFDVTQYRANPPVGGPMHWSRLVDLPIGACILLLRPLLGTHLAEVGACLIVPTLTLGCLFAAVYHVIARHVDGMTAIVGCILLAVSPTILVQMTPLRIDHHGWQIVTAAVVLAGVVHDDPRRGGWIAGLAMALWLSISGEAMPFAALTGAVVVLRYADDPREWPRLIFYLLVLAVGAGGLLLFTHGWNGSLSIYCDSFSPVYLLPLTVMPAAIWSAHAVLGDTGALRRLTAAGIGAALAGAVFLTTGGQCLAGPFEALDPMVYHFWLQGVAEGQPIWNQDAGMAVTILAPALFGAAGQALAWRAESDAGRRRFWATLLGMTLGALLIAVTVMRAMSTAHLLAIAGNAWIILQLHERIRGMTRAPARVFATVALCLLTPVAFEVGALVLRPAEAVASEQGDRSVSPDEVAALDRLPPGLILAPIDIGPEILMRTRHSVVATGHHRNLAGIRTVVHAFFAPPVQARAIVMATRARWLLVVPGTGEVGRLRQRAPHGLMAQLIDGKVPDWLHRETVPGIHNLRLYRIERTPG